MLIITGTYPPRKCGVGDYCQNLLSTDTGKNWDLYTDTNWSLSTLFKKIKAIKTINFTIANIQYPTMGYGTSLLPHCLAIYLKLFLKKKLIVTLHEFSRLGWKGQIASSIFFRYADKIIFTTEVERQFAINKHKYIKDKSSIIKIFSNIKTQDKQPSFKEREYQMGYFGYIRPDKGLEDFITVAKEILSRHPEYNIYIMGQTQTEFQKYYEPLLNNIKDTNIKIFLNQDIDTVSERLANTQIAYLPYPDGLTERRGSFLAALLNHCIIVSNKGKFTTNAQLSAFTFVNKESACVKIINILNQQADITKEIKKIDNYIKEQVPDSWDAVAKEYSTIINQLS